MTDEEENKCLTGYKKLYCTNLQSMTINCENLEKENEQLKKVNEYQRKAIESVKKQYEELELWKQKWQDAQIKANEEGFARTILQIKNKELEKENEEFLESCKDKDRQLNKWFLSYNDVMQENAELKEQIKLIESVSDANADENTELKKQEEILLDRILTLQKTNGSLTDKINMLEEQIEKMKCCSNCKCDYLHDDECYGCRIGNSYIKWELAE